MGETIIGNTFTFLCRRQKKQTHTHTNAQVPRCTCLMGADVPSFYSGSLIKIQINNK